LTSPTFLISASELSRDHVQLRGNELHHLRVRRLGPGDEVVLTDGAGLRRHGTIVKMTRAHAEVRFLAVEAGPNESTESPLRLRLALAALKADKLYLAIEKATELGVNSLVVFTSSRCVSKPAPSRLDRWQRVARSATKQCQRSTVPLVQGPVTFKDVLSTPPGPPRLLFWEGGASERIESRWVVGSEALVVVGPEGGFEPMEVAEARAAGFRIVGLGPRILRAETAAIVVVALCQRLWGDL